MHIALAHSGSEAPPPAEHIRQIFEDFHQPVYRTAYRLTGNAADAEDVLQTIFLRLLRNPGEEVACPATYLRRAAINASLDLLRQRRAKPSVLLDERSASSGPDEASDLRQALRIALSRLAPRDAEVFALRYFEDLDNGEIARAMGLSKVFVAVTLHRIRGRLRKELGELLGSRI